ncbi:MAG TPA: hypothetical protein VFQ20_07215, partial [Burkholderiaceae bacterium]|nr:hypothetical protein [Burkholderiaceae bacterium]
MLSHPRSPGDRPSLASPLTPPATFAPRRSHWPGVVGVIALVGAVAALTWLSQARDVASAPPAVQMTAAAGGPATTAVEPQPAPAAAPTAAPVEAPALAAPAAAAP